MVRAVLLSNAAKLNCYQAVNLEGVGKKPVVRSSSYGLENLFTDAAASSHVHAIAMFTKYLHAFEEVKYPLEGDTTGLQHTPQKLRSCMRTTRHRQTCSSRSKNG
jgi:hypothetical protein